jgi:GT2 family glycosyltransferase
VRVAAVVPNWNGRRWLPGCLASLAAQTQPADEVVVVDNASTDGSVAWLREHWPQVRVVALPHNTGFAGGANAGIAAAADADALALVNTDVELAPDWLARTVAVLERDARCASVATKMVDLADPGVLYDTGDILRRDGVCEQRGRFRRDDGRWDEPGEVFAACAGAALYRRGPVVRAGAFDERFFAYLEDVDLGLKLRLAGWTCRYEPVVARHAGSGSSEGLSRPVAGWAARNTVLLVARAYPWRWAPLVAYRQAAWLWHAAREGRPALRAHVAGLASALPLLPAMWRERRGLRARAVVPVDEAVPAVPWRGEGAGGHPRTAW